MTAGAGAPPVSDTDRRRAPRNRRRRRPAAAGTPASAARRMRSSSSTMAPRLSTRLIWPAIKLATAVAASRPRRRRPGCRRTRPVSGARTTRPARANPAGIRSSALSRMRCAPRSVRPGYACSRSVARPAATPEPGRLPTGSLPGAAFVAVVDDANSSCGSFSSRSSRISPPLGDRCPPAGNGRPVPRWSLGRAGLPPRVVRRSAVEPADGFDPQPAGRRRFRRCRERDQRGVGGRDGRGSGARRHVAGRPVPTLDRGGASPVAVAGGGRRFATRVRGCVLRRRAGRSAGGVASRRWVHRPGRGRRWPGHHSVSPVRRGADPQPCPDLSARVRGARSYVRGSRDHRGPGARHRRRTL